MTATPRPRSMGESQPLDTKPSTAKPKAHARTHTPVAQRRHPRGDMSEERARAKEREGERGRKGGGDREREREREKTLLTSELRVFFVRE
jgi:hypothetical protein